MQTGVVENVTKNAMRTFDIRLTDFGIPPDAEINEVRFDFSSGNAENGTYIVDDLELTR